MNIFYFLNFKLTYKIQSLICKLFGSLGQFSTVLGRLQLQAVV